jgi:hypothetical protein
MSFIFQSHWHGRFGNRMHQYAYASTYKDMHDIEYRTHSEWEGTKLFKVQQNKVYDDKELLFSLKLNNGSVNTEERDTLVLNHFKNIKKINPLDINEGYQKYDHPVFFDSLSAYNDSVFLPMDKEHLKKIFEFSDEVKETDAYKYWSKRAGTYDIAHLRRDDVSNPDFNKNNIQGYSVLSKKSYIDAFKQYGINVDKVEWCSDDYLKKWHPERADSLRLGWSYPTGSEYRPGIMFDWLEDFLRLYFARTIFRANSSFSFWACLLSPTAKVYSPILNTQVIYGINDKLEEIDASFAEGNEPHWMFNGTGSRCILI